MKVLERRLLAHLSKQTSTFQDPLQAWRRRKHLILNANKTKKKIVDFRRTGNKLDSVSVMGEEVEVVEE